AGPVGHWEFDDGSGLQVSDFSTNANHGATSGAVTWVPGLIAKNAMSFDGASGVVTMQNQAPLNPTGAISVAAWINPTSWAGGDRRIVQKGDSTNQYMLGEVGGQLVWSIATVGSVSAP